MTLHPRRDWTKTPAANANPVVRSRLRGLAVHWNGPAVPKSAFTDPRSYLEGVRRYHVNTKGWSDIAYNYAVDQTGDVWELRGWGYQSGANGGTRENDEYLAVLCILGQGQKPSDAMLAGVRSAVESFRVRYSTARKIVTHSAIRPDPTACPGPDLTRAVSSGALEPRPIPPKENDVELTTKIKVRNPDGTLATIPYEDLLNRLNYVYTQTIGAQKTLARLVANDAAQTAMLKAAATAGLDPAAITAAIDRAVAVALTGLRVTLTAQEG